MEIKILKLKLVNFKGIRDLEIDFKDVTDIKGANGTGKTTIVDAFTWLKWGKNSAGQAAFDIKTLDKKNNPIHKLEHEVSAVLLADGKEERPKRIYKEVWTKKRGEATAVFTGHETKFFWNDVPMSEAEYKAKINYIIDENLFKLLSSTTYFTSLKWTEQREILESIAGAISNEQILDSIATPANDFSHLINILNQGKSLIEYKKEISVKKKKLKEEAEQIPARIDEARRNLPESQNYAAIEAEIGAKQAELQEVDRQIDDASTALAEKNKAVLAKQNELHGEKTKLSNLSFNIRSEVANSVNNERNKISEVESRIRANENAIASCKASIENSATSIKNHQDKIEELNNKVVDARERWEKINAETFVFDESSCACPTCKQKLPESEVLSRRTELNNNFTADQSRRLSETAKEGTNFKEEIERINQMISREHETLNSVKILLANHQANGQVLETELNQVKTAGAVTDIEAEVSRRLSAHPEYTELSNRIYTLEKDIESTPKSEDGNSELRSQRANIQAGIDSLRQQLSSRDLEKQIKSRIDELERQEKAMAQQLADLERGEFDIERFTKAKMDILESRINGRFQFVKFKLFERQVNGGEAECCEALIDGVPYSSANTASKINAGLDIINTLSLQHGVRLPVFIDNRESVTDIIPTHGQIINLFVSPANKKLTF